MSARESVDLGRAILSLVEAFDRGSWVMVHRATNDTCTIDATGVRLRFALADRVATIDEWMPMLGKADRWCVGELLRWMSPDRRLYMSWGAEGGLSLRACKIPDVEVPATASGTEMDKLREGMIPAGMLARTVGDLVVAAMAEVDRLASEDQS